ncbi:MAG: cell wall hydrolase [Erythrobacter sp.]
MGQKTTSLGVLAAVATLSMTLPGVENAVAFAQDVAAGEVTQAQEAARTAQPVEIMPRQPEFVSNEVVQPIEESDATGAGNTENTASSLRELVATVATDAQLTEQMRCLAGAVYFESRGEPLYGQLAVAETVINRSEDNRWPASYCGVVLQRSQFSFVKNGRLPRINTSSAAWQRAKAVAQIAHEGLWESQAKDAVYFHASYVNPSWSRRKTRLAQIDTHIFYR